MKHVILSGILKYVSALHHSWTMPVSSVYWNMSALCIIVELCHLNISARCIIVETCQFRLYIYLKMSALCIIVETCHFVRYTQTCQQSARCIIVKTCQFRLYIYLEMSMLFIIVVTLSGIRKCVSTLYYSWNISVLSVYLNMSALCIIVEICQFFRYI